ncbi:RcnB family protein [Caulobacter sp. 17J80-11]|uniref:RcnB family protein n=1 Tax=Caulobacter sp. 17J80-11 TaxID=2763502 RepID=UPI001653B189|nr:RcnB family protein [Caulobacter sp. 17J80-11]MBC6981853.1 RcnB family protein [Caulobacter sp. 17J80-11]
MKRLLLAVAAVTAIAAPGMALADSYRGDGGYYDGRYDGGRYDGGRYDERDYGGRYDRGDYGRYERAYAREWRRGERLPPRFRGEWVNWRRAGLRPPVDRNHAWFRVGGQFVMANVNNGLIAVAIWRR